MLRVLMAAAALCAAAAPAMAADPAAGEKAFAVCKACHKVGESAKNGVGPTLNGVVGRPAGSAEGFKYSDAMKNSGITWDEANLAEYIKNPKEKVPGNKMAFAGVKDDTKLADIIAFLTQFNADGTKK
jgi:cytochrome c